MLLGMSSWSPTVSRSRAGLTVELAFLMVEAIFDIQNSKAAIVAVGNFSEKISTPRLPNQGQRRRH